MSLPENHETWPAFKPSQEAVFLRRPNRFIIIAQLDRKEVRAHCPNPGRLLELLIPGVTVILEKGEAEGRKTPWTLAAAVRKDGRVIPLYSARANELAEKIILPRLFPDLVEMRREFAIGGSRFDFLLTCKSGRKALLEVKACTLVEEGIGMFPDAPSLRASRHLEELAELTEEGYEAHALIVLMDPTARLFIPNLHTDPLFAQTLAKVSGKVNIHTVSLESDREGNCRLVNPVIPSDLSRDGLAKSNGGVYLIRFFLPESSEIEIGALGKIFFHKGWYVYAGSARKNLSQRTERHLRKRKTLRWHIDYLLAKAEEKKALPIYTFQDLECPLAEDVKGVSDGEIPGFGASDCACASHLFFFERDPLKDQGFLDVLFHYRHVRAFGGMFPTNCSFSHRNRL